MVFFVMVMSENLPKHFFFFSFFCQLSLYPRKQHSFVLEFSRSTLYFQKLKCGLLNNFTCAGHASLGQERALCRVGSGLHLGQEWEALESQISSPSMFLFSTLSSSEIGRGKCSWIAEAVLQEVGQDIKIGGSLVFTYLSQQAMLMPLISTQLLFRALPQ